MEAHFVRACQAVADLPPPSLPEIAVAGRSNCGKSSLINAVTRHSKLARTSSTPGRTRQLIYFHITPPGSPPFYLVDLPGYGYAKAPKQDQREWARLVNHYVDRRDPLKALILLSDIRRNPKQEERDLLAWAGERELATLVVLTKADKVKKGERFTAAARAKRDLGLDRRPLVVAVDDRTAVQAVRDGLLGLVEA